MELIRGLSGAHRRADGCVLTIGAYDGIHLGHQALLARVHEHAARCGAAAVLLPFEPMPREYLAPADPRARRWLGRPWSMRGRGMAGKRLGRDLGFPTANLPLGRRRAPVAGIFAVRVHGVASAALPGVASLGTRPTIGAVEALLEAHLFDFSGELYGREVEVEFAAKLRDEAHFATLEALTAQMRRDAADARRILKC